MGLLVAVVERASHRLPVRWRLGLGHLVEHGSHFLPVVKVLPLVVELQDDSNDLQDLHTRTNTCSMSQLSQHDKQQMGYSGGRSALSRVGELDAASLQH